MTNKELIQYGIEAGQFPRFLYKFFSYKQPFIDSIKNSYIWYSKPADFNDPFDGSISLQWNGTEAQYENYLQVASAGRLTSDKIKEYAKKMYLNPKVTKDQLDGIFSETINRIGVACFSEVNDNILMWSHYADCHKGICVKYDLSKITGEHEIYLVSVKYETEYPMFNYISKGNPTNLSQTVIGTKSSDWSYEREFRLLSITQGKNITEKESVVEVIFGCRCAEEKKIIDLFNSNGYNPIYSKAQKKELAFGLDILKCS